jgi:CheY-like chemotaxis protein
MIIEKSIIMLVEDNEDHIELTVNALREANLTNKIVVMKDGTKAISYLKGDGEYSDRKTHSLPILILLDLKMPKLGGKEVLKMIKNDEGLKTIPVVILTSSGMESDKEECYKLGANSYIVKPISFGAFVEKVKSIPLYWLLVNSLPER